MKVEVKREVSKEAHELVQAVLKLCESAKLALKDGFQPGADLPAIVLGSMQELMKGVEGVDKLDDEARDDLDSFIAAWMIGGSDIAKVFLKK